MERVVIVCELCSCEATRCIQHHRRCEAANKPRYCRKCARQESLKRRPPEMLERLRAIASANLKRLRAAQTPEQKSSLAKAARRRVNSKAAVAKQWATIKSSPDKFDALKKRRSITSKSMWDARTPEERVELFRKVFANKNGVSKAAKQFLERLSKSGILLDVECGVHGFIVDALVRNTKTIIEFYGDVFHCNPKIFTEPSRYCSWISRTVQEQWDRDRKRLAVFYRYGYRVIVVWESDWYSNPEKELERIKNALCQSGENPPQV